MIKAIEYCTNVFDGTHDTPKPCEKGYKLLTSKNILKGLLDKENAYFISEEDYNSINQRSKVKKWDVLFSMIGTVGNVCIINDDNIDFAIKNMGVFSCDDEKKAKWLYFYMQSPQAQNIIKNYLNGAVQKFLPLGKLREFLIPEFDCSKEKIVSLLWNIECKIKNNNKINEELENITKTIYDYWFLQFDFPDENGKPYKSSGGKMVWNEELKKDIPEGWEAKELQSVCNIRRGSSPRPIKKFMDKTCKGIPWIKIADVTSNESPFVIEVKEYIIKEGIEKSVHVIPGTLIVSNSATPGIPKFVDIDACVHDGWLVIDNYKQEYKYYLYYVIKMIRENLINIASGSIFKNLKTDYLKEYTFVNPSQDTLNKYHKLLEPIMQKILLKNRENQQLLSLRDFLLPLLMNGQVAFKEE